MRNMISVIGAGVVFLAGGCAQVSSVKLQQLENSISKIEGSHFGAFMTQGNNCADNLYHARLHLTEARKVSGTTVYDAGAIEIDQGLAHVNEAARQCHRAEEELKAWSANMDILVLDVLFAHDDSNLNADSKTILDSVHADLKAMGYLDAEIWGHTDSTGNASYNMSLAQRRADSVRSYLISKGCPAESLSAKGFGASDPVASNDTSAGRAKNRRVELHYQHHSHRYH